jgi:hypothetical protein
MRHEQVGSGDGGEWQMAAQGMDDGDDGDDPAPRVPPQPNSTHLDAVNAGACSSDVDVKASHSAQQSSAS